MIDPREMISPAFNDVYDSLVRGDFEYRHLWLKGGRFSLKSSFMGLIIPFLMMRDASWVEQGIISESSLSNAVVLRKFGNTSRESTFAQIEWGIRKLGVEELWESTLAPLTYIYRPTGQKIYFRGLDDATKTKSIKASIGRFVYVWYEELEEFNGMPEIRKANQSFFRGGDGLEEKGFHLKNVCFCTYNPPLTMASWVNEEAAKNDKTRKVLHSTYLDIPEKKRIAWIGADALEEAEALKIKDPRAYRHEYLGEVVGTSGAIFKNLSAETIDDDQIRKFPNVLTGIDWGFGHPFVWLKVCYDKVLDTIYVYDEIVETELLNKDAMRLVREHNKGDRKIGIIADSAEKKSILEWRGKGFNIRGARKRKNSEKYGIKWIAGRTKLVVDPARCPKAYQQLSQYEFVRDKEGRFTDQLPKLNDDVSDCLRYTLENQIFPMAFSFQK
jgi:PBSX family phage terminase large subunit